MRTEISPGRMGARHLSQIQEESESREHSTGFLPAIAQQQTGGTGKPGGAKTERRDVRLRSNSVPLAVYDQQRKLEKNRTLLEELTHVEAELRESLHVDEARRQAAEFLRQQENKLLWQNLCFLSLSQRVAKPWVSSYFRKFPMHIYCLPIQSPCHKGRRHAQKRKR
ncbi:hypothetical protein AMECASPLE_012470 [Ameca splendens]|uniref:Uncharacterized protein n=1 Tax=Ameca splendens TaxID=208324 RepID=A0ABV0Y1I0_9TELE